MYKFTSVYYDWASIWQYHLDEYLKVPPRTAYFINAYYPLITTALEVACGSSRDSLYLANKRGIDVTATDFNKDLIDKLKKRFNCANLNYIVSDAFNLPFGDNEFDLVFHNGLFIYYDNNSIRKMLSEQYRTSKKYVLFFVHNKLNGSLVKSFSQLALRDQLYKIRFFEPLEVIDIILSADLRNASLKLRKFGGKADLLYSLFDKKAFPKVFQRFIGIVVPRLYQMQSWRNTERIACLMELRK